MKKYNFKMYNSYADLLSATYFCIFLKFICKQSFLNKLRKSYYNNKVYKVYIYCIINYKTLFLHCRYNDLFQ